MLIVYIKKAISDFFVYVNKKDVRIEEFNNLLYKSNDNLNSNEEKNFSEKNEPLHSNMCLILF